MYHHDLYPDLGTADPGGPPPERGAAPQPRRRRRQLRLAALLATTVVVGLATTAAGRAAASDRSDDVTRLKQATARFHDPTAAEQIGGYQRFVDVDGIACIDMPGLGAMGVHYVNGDLVGDGEIDLLHPEAVIYQPGPEGSQRLVAAEYVVPKAAWDAHHSSPPELFGTEFDFTASPNRFGLPDFYSLHAWVWKQNPAGTFTMWNPDVSCTPGDRQHQHHQHTDQETHTL